MKANALPLPILPASCLAAAAQVAPLKFDFKPGRPATGYQQVLPTAIYTK